MLKLETIIYDLNIRIAPFFSLNKAQSISIDSFMQNF